MSRLCTICARGGSIGVKHKNLRDVCGKPLIAHTISQAKQAGCFDEIVVSSDSQAILDVAKEWGATYVIRRPDEMATSEAAKLPVIRHAAKEAENYFKKTFSVMVDLDATSPLRLAEDILGAIELLETSKADNVITAAPARRSPYFNLVELDNDGIVGLSKSLPEDIVRRQDSPRCFDMNASIYVWQREALMGNEKLFTSNTRLFEMPEERSIDIDSELDFKLVSFLASDREDLCQ